MKNDIGKIGLFQLRGAVGVPSCQAMLFSRVGYQTHFSFVECSVKDTHNTIKPIHEKPIETFMSHTLRASLCTVLAPHTQLTVMSALHRSSVACDPEIFFLSTITSALLLFIGQ